MKHFFIVLAVILLEVPGIHGQVSTSAFDCNRKTKIAQLAAPRGLAVTSYDFRRKRILKDYEGTILLGNLDTAPITIQRADLIGSGNFTVVGDVTGFKNLTLQPGKEVTFPIIFSPLSTGLKSATIRFITTAGDTVESQLDGDGIIGRLATVDLDFGTTELKTEEYSKKRFMIQCRNWEFEDSVTITDVRILSGTVSEDIKSPFSSDGFRYNKGEITFPITIHPGQTLVFLDSVEFQAQVHGSSIARLQTVSNAEAEVISVWTGKGASTSVENDHLTMSECSFTLSSNPVTHDGGMIEFTLPKRNTANLSIHSLTGEKVVTLLNSIFDSGTHHASIPVERLSAGVYVVRMVVGDCVIKRTMVVVK